MYKNHIIQAFLIYSFVCAVEQFDDSDTDSDSNDDVDDDDGDGMSPILLKV